MQNLTSSINGDLRKPIMAKLQEIDFFNPERIKSDSKKVFTLAEKKQDCTNMQRNTEFRANVAGMITTKVDQNVNMSGELNTISHDAPEDELFNVCKNLKARRAQALRQ